MLDQLERAQIARLRIHPETITIDHPGGIGLIDFEAASVSPAENEIAIDRLQMLAATAAVAGADRALAHAALATPASPRSCRTCRTPPWEARCAGHCRSPRSSPTSCASARSNSPAPSRRR